MFFQHKFDKSYADHIPEFLEITTDNPSILIMLAHSEPIVLE